MPTRTSQRPSDEPPFAGGSSPVARMGAKAAAISTDKRCRSRISYANRHISDQSAVVSRVDRYATATKEINQMGIGVSLLLIAAGAILAFAVHATSSGFSVHTVGIILLVVGILGALISVMFWSSWGGFGGRTTDGARRTTVIED